MGMTFSDRELRKRIAGQRRMLAKARPGSWTAEKLQEELDSLERELAKPRSERCQFTKGSLGDVGL
jgi:hypothetical protein